MSSPRVFIIDDHADFRRLLGHHLAVRWPQAVIEEYDPLIRGPLPEGFSGAGHDLVLLGHPVGQGDALPWLRRLRSHQESPPVVFLGSGEERQIVGAIRAGAVDYITKSGLTHQRVVEAVEQALATVGQLPEPTRAGPGGGVPGAVRGLPGYEIISPISEGEIATIYLARERSGGRVVALKVLRQVSDSGSEQHFDRFLQEYELIAHVQHSNIVRIFDLGVADDHAYIAMEYCSGGSLKRRIGQGMAPGTAYGLMRVIAGALGALHAVGICHRDLKPTNIMFRHDGSPVLIDFGLAKQVHLKAGITGAGTIFGTPYYMSPEQGQGSVVDQRSDIYSLGIVFYEMLTGQKPYDGPAALAVIIQHRESPLPRLPPPLRHFQPLLDQMLAKKPGQRFQSVDEILAWQPQDPAPDVAASGKGH